MSIDLFRLRFMTLRCLPMVAGAPSLKASFINALDPEHVPQGKVYQVHYLPGQVLPA